MITGREQTARARTVELAQGARDRIQIHLLAAGSVAPVLAALVLAAVDGPAARALAGALGVALVVVPLVLIRRLELIMYTYVPLMAGVVPQPAPVDFMTAGVLGALAIRGDIRRAAPPRAILIALPLFIAANVVSLLAAARGSGPMFLAQTLLMVAVGCVGYELAAKDRKVAERAMLGAGFLLLIESMIAFSPLGDLLGMREAGSRMRGFLTDANEFGSLAIPAILLLLVRWPSLAIHVRAIGIGLLLIPVALSASRAAALSLGVSAAVLAAIAAYRGLRRVFFRATSVLAIGSVGALLLVALYGSLPERDIGSLIQPYDAERFAAQAAGLHEYLTRPLSLGIGPGNFEAQIGHESHQMYLRVLVESGPIALLGLLAMIVTALRVAARPDLNAVVWGAILAGLLASGLFIDTLHWRFLWFVLGVTASFAVREPRETGQT